MFSVCACVSIQLVKGSEQKQHLYLCDVLIYSPNHNENLKQVNLYNCSNTDLEKFYVLGWPTAKKEQWAFNFF